MIRLSAATLLLAAASMLAAQTPTPAATTPAPAAATAAQPNLSGAWKLNVNKSEFGQVPPPNSEYEIIQQTPTAITIATASDSDDTGKAVYILPIAIAATEAPTPAGEFPATADFKITASRGQWQGATLVVDQKMNYKGSEGTIHSTYTLSADGKTLTRQTHYSLDLGEFDVTYIFDKQ